VKFLALLDLIIFKSLARLKFQNQNYSQKMPAGGYANAFRLIFPVMYQIRCAVKAVMKMVECFWFCWEQGLPVTGYRIRYQTTLICWPGNWLVVSVKGKGRFQDCQVSIQGDERK
jgi:hypothetical protein